MVGAGMIAFVGALPTYAANEPLVQRFAECAGRLSAQMEYSWLVNLPPEQITTLRASMIALLDAVTPVDARRQVLAQRIAAKAAHWSLLTRATFNDDAQDAAWARARAEQSVSSCASLALS